MNYPRYFIRSRRVAGQVAGGRVNIGFRETDAAEAEPHLRALARRMRDESSPGTASFAFWNVEFKRLTSNDRGEPR